MARRASFRPAHEPLSRSVQITTVAVRVALYPDDTSRDVPIGGGSASLELQGTADELIAETSDVAIHISAADKADRGIGPPPCVGAIIQVRPIVSVVVAFPHLEFDRLWAMALAGGLTHAHLTFVKPRYGKARVLNLSLFSNAEG
jgi:hypothetical protein